MVMPMVGGSLSAGSLDPDCGTLMLSGAVRPISITDRTAVSQSGIAVAERSVRGICYPHDGLIGPSPGYSLLIRLPTTLAVLLASLTAMGTARAELTYLVAGPAVSVIDSASHTTIASIFVGHVPYRLAVTPDCSKVYVGQFHESNVSVIGTARSHYFDTV
jgi:hypothetical protein